MAAGAERVPDADLPLEARDEAAPVRREDRARGRRQLVLQSFFYVVSRVGRES